MKLTFATILSLLASVGLSAETSLRFEAEDGLLLDGTEIGTSRPGFSGSGYVTGFANDTAQDSLTVNVSTTGLYDLVLRYASPYGPKQYQISVNGEAISGGLSQTSDWADQSCGKVYLLDGDNEVVLQKGWGYFDVDYIELTHTVPVDPLKPPAVLSDPNATVEAQQLHQKLIDNYGSAMFSGDYDFEHDDQDLLNLTGRYPAILGGDFMDYSPSRLPYENPGNATETWIERVEEYGFIMKMVWHWNAPTDLKPDQPWYKGFYTYATTFNVSYAMGNQSSEDYQLILRDLDAIAIQLKKFQDAGIAVLWRPLHEAEGGWFWWGAQGPEAYIELYRLMYDRFVNLHGLHNLLWIHNSVNADWYPGDDVVDIIGVDQYPSDVSDPVSSLWDELQSRFDGKKLLALTEFGGVPDVEKMFLYGSKWSFFVTWPGYLHTGSDNSIIQTYESPYTITLSPLEADQ